LMAGIGEPAGGGASPAAAARAHVPEAP
jgi:hypothetical protein